jgi:DNA-binding beta-propeller fold protein YncE
MSLTQRLTRRPRFGGRASRTWRRLLALPLAGTLSLALSFGLSAAVASAMPSTFGQYFNVPVNVPGAGPTAVDPSNHQVYEAGDGELTVLDGTTGQQIKVIQIAGSEPQAVSVDPATHDVYVANGIDGTGGGSLSIIDGANLDAPVTTVPISGFPQGVAVNPSTDTVYVSNGDELVYALNAADGQEVAPPIRVGFNPSALAVDPATDTVYVADFNGATPQGGGEVWTINGATNTANPDPITGVGLEPSSIAVDQSTGTVYVVSAFDTISEIPRGSRQATHSAPLPLGPDNSSVGLGVAVDPSTDTVYVAEATGLTVMFNGADLAAKPVTVTVNTSVTYEFQHVSVDPSTHLAYFSAVFAHLGGTEDNFLVAIAPFATTVPSAPSDVTATAGIGDAARVVFTAPASDGGAPIGSYTISAVDDTHSAGDLEVTVPADAVVDGKGSWVVTDLAGGDTYQFFVSAVNAVGTGPASAPSNAVTLRKSGGGCTPATCQ